MKKVTLLCGMLLAITASVASAASGTNLRWSACFGDGGTLNRASTCATNSGTNALVGSFEVGAPVLGVTGVEIVIDIATAGGALPPWWQFVNLGACRQASLTMNPTISPLAVACADWASGAAAGGLAAYQVGLYGPNTARIKGGFAVAAAAAADVFPAQEYFSFNANINNAKTVGTGSCAGCQTPACLICNSILVATPDPARSVKLSGPTNGTDSNYATWQGGGGISVGGRTGCPEATPTRNATWGSVKSLYR